MRSREEQREERRRYLEEGDAQVLRAIAQVNKLNADIERLRSAIESAVHQLEKARIWNGGGWTYNPLHPMFYVPALDALRTSLTHNVELTDAAKRPLE